jgi:hypothetical protein
MAMDFTALSPDSRRSLQQFFKPFAILATPDLTPGERALELEAAGFDAERFCSDHAETGAACIAQRARETLSAICQQRQLLRMPDPSAKHAELPRVPHDIQRHSPPSLTIWQRFAAVLAKVFARR